MTTTTSATPEQCAALRNALLALHRQLIELERRDYEKLHGRQSAGEFLQVMAYAESMRWMEPLSRLIVMLDEAMEPGNADIAEAPPVVARRVREMLKLEHSAEADFSGHYQRHFHTSPELAMAHAAVIRALG
ncbi:hypothetical protein PMI14_03054 [Acidovorax sp. CF316]|uniref:hypothetical protein n=1 Tax=Acidovorax sp. CF316 TaxID=1144317 RepID=UPI00026BCB61|nr:hypothetical protein [Acidovorax sp. CF316]EJE52251.1 hypothetical protein PMI14_03054 [Acidovorax sp. CF316]